RVAQLAVAARADRLRSASDSDRLLPGLSRRALPNRRTRRSSDRCSLRCRGDRNRAADEVPRQVRPPAQDRTRVVLLAFLGGQLKHWIDSYGYEAIFVLVGLESIGVPLPGETALITGALY